MEVLRFTIFIRYTFLVFVSLTCEMVNNLKLHTNAQNRLNNIKDYNWILEYYTTNTIEDFIPFKPENDINPIVLLNATAFMKFFIIKLRSSSMFIAY